MAKKKNDRIKVAGYARRIFFNDNIEYRNFSPDLVGLQFTSDGGTPLFTNGNFSITTNMDPKPNVVFTQGTKSRYFTLEDIDPNSEDSTILNNLVAELNLDISNPLTYVWYGSVTELVKSSLLDIENQWPAAIYVDDKVGSVTGNNITNYVYDVVTDESTFTVNSRFFVNPYGIEYTEDASITGTETPINPLRNFTNNHKSYVIEHNGISKKIKSITAATQTTNALLEIVTEGNPFPELTGVFLPQFSILFTPVDASIPFLIKPNETQIELFFSQLNNLQKNLLNRNTYPPYKSIIIGPRVTDSGVIVTVKEVLTFPLLDDGYNLNFFDGFYLAYLNKLNTIAETYDENQTDLIVRKYTAEVISSFDTVPSGDGNDILLDGEKATKLLRIYGVSFDEVKKFINGIKFAHTVTYDRKNNTPDALVKDLSYMLGLDPVTFVTNPQLNKIVLPSESVGGQFSGTSTNYSELGMDIELYRRLILNLAWVWKSKGSRKAIEFLFRFIGAPEALVRFNEYIVILDEPLDMDKIKELLYLYTGDDEETIEEYVKDNIPYDSDGFPLPPSNGSLVITDFISGPDNGTTATTLSNTSIQTGNVKEMYFQKAGGWYRETFGGSSPTILRGNNPHVGPYDGGNEYLDYFSRCYIPNFTGETIINVENISTTTNAFLNYNNGIFNDVPDNTDFYTREIVLNPTTGGYQPISNCLDVEYNLVETPLQYSGQTTIEIELMEAQQAYDNYLLLIKQNPYLKYSPEWTAIQDRLVRAQEEYGLEVSTQEYVPGQGLINKTLEICLSPTDDPLESPQDIIQCEEYNVATLDEFIYFTDENGIKQKFNGIEECCNKNEGKYYNFFDGYYDIGFCAVEDPCTGKPSKVDRNGVVVFELTGNIMPPNVINYNGNCYQYDTNCGPQTKEVDGCENEAVYPIYNTPEFWAWVKQIYGTPQFDECFTQINCDKGTIVSSPACCLYHGYKPIQQTILDTDGTPVEIYVCVDESSPNTPEDLSTSTLTYVIPNLVNGYSELLPQSNMNSNVDIVAAIAETSDVLPTVGYYTATYTAPPTLNSYFNDPDLNNPNKNIWKIESIDEQGRLTFSAFDNDGNKVILDWTAPSDAGSALYQKLVLLYGYSMIGDQGVDTNFIPCTEVNDVTLVFGVENYNGFKLPAGSECSCSIDIEFDYMLKYEAENLINCAEVICFPAVFSDLTKSSINCKNFITFTTSEEESTKLTQNYDFDPETEEYTIWQNDVTQVEPNKECCEAFGGQIVAFEPQNPNGEWNTTTTQWVQDLKTKYNDLLDDNIDTSSYNTNLTTLGFELRNIIGDLEIIVNSDCIEFSPFVSTQPPCPYTYLDYVTTENICSLPVDEECGLWSLMLNDYKDRLKWAYDIKEDLENCVNKNQGEGDDEFDDIEVVPIEDEVAANNLFDNEAQSEYESNNQQIDNLNNEITENQTRIDDLNTQNQTLRRATTQTSTDTDCTVYETQIQNLNNFNYTNYCKNNLVVQNPDQYWNELNKCITSKTKEVTTEKNKYQELLALCQNNNKATEELQRAQNQNQQDRIITYTDEIKNNDAKINNITTTLNDEVLNKSAAQEVDQLYIIKTAADVLGVTESSITNNGNISLTSLQKVSLDVKQDQNNQVINTLNKKIGELGAQQQALIQSNIIIENQRKSNGTGIGSTLLTIGGAIIGTALIAKGFLDPETAGGLMLGAGNLAGGIKGGGGGGGPQGLAGCPDPNAQNYMPQAVGCGPGYGQYVTGNYTQSLQGGDCVMVNACCRKACPAAGDGGGDLGGGDEFIGDVVGLGGDSGGNPGDSDVGVGDSGSLGDVGVVSECNFCLGKPSDMAGQYFGPGAQPFEGQNPVFDGSGNYISVPQSCCNQSAIGVPVQWFTQWGGQGWCITTDLGFNVANGEAIANERANCVFGIVGCMTIGAINYDPQATIPCEGCCTFRFDPGDGDGGSPVETDIVGCMEPDAINYNPNANAACETCCLYEDPCCDLFLDNIIQLINTLETFIPQVETQLDEAYNKWNNQIITQFNNYVTNASDDYLTFIDDLKLNFKLFVDNTNGGGGNVINSALTYLPYTETTNPIWEWDPNQMYSGIYITGSSANVAEVESVIFNDLSLTNPTVSMDTLFQPQWKTLNFHLEECVCDELRTLYPFGQFYFGLEVEDYECGVCLLIDNIRVNITDCQTDKSLSIDNCLIPQLACVIDNKKSWVYTSDGIVTQTVYPNGECNTECSENYEVTKILSPINRYWEELEYRYTDYDTNHSDLIINTKSATFALDPANAIECDVYNFWREINCDECPTACETGGTVSFTGELIVSGDTISGYTLELSGTTVGGPTFSCETYTTILENQIVELKNDYYTATADLSASLNATYEDLLKIGGNLSLFDIEGNNCNSNNILIGNDKKTDNLFGVLVEEPDSTISFWETYVYSATTPYSGGRNIEIFSGVTAQTFNQTGSFTQECCENISKLLKDKGTTGLGVDKDYVWNESVSACTWATIDDCEGDCAYSGVKNINHFIPECVTATTIFDIVVTGTSSGTTTGYTPGYCVGSYTATPAGDACQYIVSSAATYSGVDFTAYTGSLTGAYSVNGTKWYGIDLNTSALPYKVSTSTTLRDDNNVAVPTLATNNSESLWSSLGAGANGRLNNCGIWATAGAPLNNPPFQTWLGFSRCIQINTAGTYCIGLAADNRTRFYLDGNLMFTSAGQSGNANYDLSIWKVFEIELTSGEHIIEMEGYNYQSQASFGAEVYSATTAQLTGMTTTAELDNVTIFTTKDFRSDVNPGTYLFDFGASATSTFGYSCPSGWSFAAAPCYASATCVKVESSGLTYDITGTTTSTTTSTTVTVTGTTTACTDTCVVTGVTTCVNPLNYLDVPPSEIMVKEVFDEMVLSNLIDAKSRQVISNYPTLMLFYQLYLTASNCGKDLTSKFTYNDMFQFMDKIGDYWLDLIEQAVPATTIWEGCDNSGKIYRNTIFDQNKYVYRKYVLNFNDSELCAVSGVTDQSIGEAAVDVLATELSLYPTNDTINNLMNQSSDLQNTIFTNTLEIERLENRKCVLEHQDPSQEVTNEILQIEADITQLNQSISQDQVSLSTTLNQISSGQTQLVTQQEVFQTQYSQCNSIGTQIVNAMQALADNFIPGSVEYERQLRFIASLRYEYNKCLRKNDTQISNYDTVFITQIYSSNEYEGTVTVTGDPEWEPGGPFYNSELIHNCV